MALFVSAPAAEVRSTAEAIGAGSVQLHGAVTPEYCDELAGLRRIVAVQGLGGNSLVGMLSLLGCMDAVLFDAVSPGLYGGTGLVSDWDQAAETREAIAPLPLLLAGGLTPHNVEEAIAAGRPEAVDVASGVESRPGVKDAALIAAFAAAVRRSGGAGGERR